MWLGHKVQDGEWSKATCRFTLCDLVNVGLYYAFGHGMAATQFRSDKYRWTQLNAIIYAIIYIHLAYQFCSNTLSFSATILDSVSYNTCLNLWKLRLRSCNVHYIRQEPACNLSLIEFSNFSEYWSSVHLKYRKNHIIPQLYHCKSILFQEKYCFYR